ncbi:MAG: hypothetical protein M1383_06150 [Patescibacteria group bacterium]|nr:hypothetical protein [Patescibacteria group bacterium]
MITDDCEHKKIPMELTKVEHDIIMDLRSAKPFEEVRITKDQLGRFDSYLFVSTQKKIYSGSKAHFS